MLIVNMIIVLVNNKSNRSRIIGMVMVMNIVIII